MKNRIFTTYVGGRGGSSDIVYFSTFDVMDIAMTIVKTDLAANTGLYGINALLKPFTYSTQILHNDAPNAAYLWLPPDGGTTAHEAVSGAAMTISGAGGGVVNNSFGATRYAGQMGMLGGNNAATLAGFVGFLTAAENAGQHWSWEGWVLWLSAAVCNIYIETNLALTNYLAIQISAAGVLSVVQSGVVKWTAPVALPAVTWRHVGLSYNATAATIVMYLNGVSAGAAAAYARAATYASAEAVINQQANNAVQIGGVAVYQNVLMGADDYNRHYYDMTTDVLPGAFVQYPSTLNRLDVVSVLFTNEAAGGLDTANHQMRLPLTPLVAIQNNGGLYYVEASIREFETGGT